MEQEQRLPLVSRRGTLTPQPWERASPMSKLLERAIAEVRKLPPDGQDQAAQALFEFLEIHTAPRLTAEQQARVRASMAAREFLTDEELRAMYAKYGL